MKIKIKAHKASRGKFAHYLDVCEHCRREITFTLNKVKYGEYGCAYVECPVCGKRTFVLNGELDFALTKANFKYPQHFADLSDAAYHIPDEEIENMCKKCVDAVSDSANESSYALQACGDALVFAIDGTEETYVYVCRNYKELIIDKEET